MTGIAARVEGGSFGRTIVARLLPNEDLVEGIVKACAQHGVACAVIKGGIGSLTDAAIAYGAPSSERVRSLSGPAIEVLTLQGDVRAGADGTFQADVWGTAADTAGIVYGGRFLRGQNPVCVTMEIVLQEWTPAA